MPSKDPRGLVCSILRKTHRPTLWQGPSSELFKILVKTSNRIPSNSKTRRHSPPDCFLWSSRSFTICDVNHKCGLASLLLKTYRLPPHHRRQSAASHLQAHLPEFTHVLWAGPVYLLANKWTKHNFPITMLNCFFDVHLQFCPACSSAYTLIWIRSSSDDPLKPQHC